MKQSIFAVLLVALYAVAATAAEIPPAPSGQDNVVRDNPVQAQHPTAGEQVTAEEQPGQAPSPQPGEETEGARQMPVEPPAEMPGEIPGPPGGPVAAPPLPTAPGSPPAVPPAASPGPPTIPARQPSPAGGSFLVKFNNADVYEVIHTLARVAGINYLIDPRVRGVVNVHTQGAVGRADALELLFSILRINGATAVKEGPLYHIVPISEAKTEPLVPSSPEEKGPGASPNRMVMRVFPLQYISASEMAKVIRPFLSPGADATEVTRANILLVTDTAANLEKHTRLVELFDADAFRSAGVRLFPLKFLDPEEMGKNLESIFGALDFGGTGKPSGINFVPLGRLNSLLVVTASPKTMADVDRWIQELDRETSVTARGVHLYRVRHGKAADLMAILEKLYPEKAVAAEKKPTQFTPRVAEASATSTSYPGVTVETTQENAAKSAEPSGNKKESAGVLSAGGFDIILDEPTNGLIIRGSISEYASILGTLKAIDVYPRQVLLEVLIGEVRLDDALKLGVDWKYMNTWGGYDYTVSNVTGLASDPAVLPTGFRYLVEKTDRLTAAFRALANDGKVSILSAPSVIAANGKKSKIEVADSVPIVTASIIANSNPPVTSETVQYQDVGILLNFTPFVNDEGIVTLEISQEVSEVNVVSSTTATQNPTIFKRTVETTLIAARDQSIVLGGLVRERKTKRREGIPYLYKIPVFGWLFGSEDDVVERGELLIFVTPRVIGTVEEGTRIAREFEERVQELKRQIEEAKGIRKAPEAPEKKPE